MTLRVLLIDDDRRLFELLGEYLGKHEVVVEHAADGPSGLARLAEGGHDLVLLDVMMPGMDGLTVLKRIRQDNSVPVVMLTARGDEADRVVGLELGADDYVAKPFSARELLARLRAVLRRVRPGLMDERLSAGGLVMDVPRRQVSLDGAAIDVTGLEFDLLLALLRRAGRVVPRETLLSLAGRDEVVGERTVDVHISHLRRKLGDDPRRPERIRTVRGVGYLLATPS
ncbi:MAG: response regulator transcription factor [Sandaracinaceae bacterium]|jgi:two-component system OmpR family response regulator|nr:response regulator transcription factor [Sandaracinaceae bacterium]MBP7681752.1 response regulator transcription factor [Deltaproteobacteria bacterium]MBK7154231.1 response regulator transcription factor [Sandaracinaceae bacterium]MBK7776378.1 response regulator transcription factor [Sandaracinaceae bacterium]MBK8409200.1 response regulator transcription factor [Sandaracinaceae bacterium]